MATNVLLPQWGMNMEDGTLVRWLVKEGDAVEEGQPLVEIETAKINSELEAPESGVLAHILAPEGSTVDVGTVLAIIARSGETVPRPSTAPKRRRSIAGMGGDRKAPSDKVGRARPPGPDQVTPVARRLARQHDIALEQVQGSGPSGRITEEDVRRTIEAVKSGLTGPAVPVVPRARLLAKEEGIDLSRLVGTGPSGRILVSDVEQAVYRREQEKLASRQAGVREVIPLKGLRRTIADRMMQSVRTAAQVTLTTEADVTEAVRLRELLVSRWRADRIRPLDLDLVVKATAEALSEYPRLNATLVDDEVRLLAEVNVGVAMAVPDGLMVPVIARADQKDLLAIARQMRDLADKSRRGKLGVDDVTGASFTITSLASYEIDAFTPILDPPQVAILGVGRVVLKPGIYGGEIAPRSMMYLSLTFDHRALDGMPAGEFLRSLKGKLEAPGWMAAGG